MGRPLEELGKLLHRDDIDSADRRIEAAHYAVTQMMRSSLAASGEKLIVTEENCDYYLWRVVESLLAAGRKEDTVALLWRDEMFSLRPQSARDIWAALESETWVNILGALGMGKSLTLAGWFLVDWLEDPDWTCVKCVSVTKEHAKTNVFSHLKTLHEYASFKLPGERSGSYIRSTDNDKQGIQLLSIPRDDKGDVVLRGHHPSPRPGGAHPRFGILTRVRALLDEAEAIPRGVWKGVGNMLGTVAGPSDTHVKGAAATNPVLVHSVFAELSEPQHGWTSLDRDLDKSWRSKRTGWYVLRLSGA